MSTTRYVFMEKEEKNQHFSDEKSALSVAMLFSEKNKKNIISLPSAEFFAQRVVKVKVFSKTVADDIVILLNHFFFFF